MFLSQHVRDVKKEQYKKNTPFWLACISDDNALISLRSWRYYVIKVLAAEPRSKKRSGDEVFEIPTGTAAPPPNLTRLVQIAPATQAMPLFTV